MSMSFLWGAAISGYQAEGGYNGPGQPQTNWADAEQRSRVDALGQASDFLSHAGEDLERCRALGLNAFRLSIEWSRVQPTFHNQPGPPPPFDAIAIEAYAAIVVRCRRLSLEPIVTLHHFVHPAWLGADPWLSPDTVPLFEQFALTVVRGINQQLVQLGLEPIRYFITVNEPNMLVLSSYIGSQFPRGPRGGLRLAMRALINLLEAHRVVYAAIHDGYQAENWGRVQLTFNTYTSDIYWLDQFLTDVLMVREFQVEKSAVAEFFWARARAFNRATDAFTSAHLGRTSRGLGLAIRHLGMQLGPRLLSLKEFKDLIDRLYAQPRVLGLDYLAFDYYDPFSAHLFRWPRVRDWLEGKNQPFGGFRASFFSKWWDWRVLPEGLAFFAELLATNYPQKRLLIAENGMAHRRDLDNTTVPRRDGLLRSEFIRLHVEVVDRIRTSGVPLMGYLHWSLFDNYEWGTYSARFGLFSLDYTQDTERRAEDHHGDCPSEAYARAIQAARGGARVVEPEPAPSAEDPQDCRL